MPLDANSPEIVAALEAAKAYVMVAAAQLTAPSVVLRTLAKVLRHSEAAEALIAASVPPEVKTEFLRCVSMAADALEHDALFAEAREREETT